MDKSSYLEDDALVTQFFNENKQEIADEGFSARVMRRLPTRAVRLNCIWTVLCTIVGVAFFVWADGFGQLNRLFYNCVGNISGFLSSIDFVGTSPLMVIAGLFLLMIFAIWNVIERELYSI